MKEEEEAEEVGEDGDIAGIGLKGWSIADEKGRHAKLEYNKQSPGVEASLAGFMGYQAHGEEESNDPADQKAPGPVLQQVGGGGYEVDDDSAEVRADTGIEEYQSARGDDGSFFGGSLRHCDAP